MDFKNGKELLKLCKENDLPISEIMLRREIELSGNDKSKILDKLNSSLNIMRDACHTPIHSPTESLGGLIGGEAKKIWDFSTSPMGTALLGKTLTKGIAYGMACLEVNATMGLIVAAPTAGSCGVIPGVLFSLGEDLEFSDDALLKGLITTGALGYIMMRNASVSGAEAGCQAEVGSASAMASTAICELLGGTPEMCLEAASLAISNILGMVCDPISGLVESPCQSRNAIGVSNAYTSAQLALSGIKHTIPFDEMVDVMYKVGTALPVELRETALGGNAIAPTACSLCSGCK